MRSHHCVDTVRLAGWFSCIWWGINCMLCLTLCVCVWVCLSVSVALSAHVGNLLCMWVVVAESAWRCVVCCCCVAVHSVSECKYSYCEWVNVISDQSISQSLHTCHTHSVSVCRSVAVHVVNKLCFTAACCYDVSVSHCSTTHALQQTLHLQVNYCLFRAVDS